MPTLSITSKQLLAAFTSWEQDNRAGRCRPPEESAALPLQQVAAENLLHFLPRLLEAGAMQTPAIGQPWPEQGGIYAGLVRGVDGNPDQHLVLAAALPPKRLNWKDACTWGTSVRDSDFTDWSLPTRDESALLYANVRHLVEGGWHWTGTQYSAGDAWLQVFSSGLQSYFDKSFEARARAVRRFNAQSFNPSEGEQ